MFKASPKHSKVKVRTWLLVTGMAMDTGGLAYLLGDDAEVVIRSPTPPFLASSSSSVSSSPLSSS